MHSNNHTVIAMIFGAVSVNVPIHLDTMFTYNALLCVFIFCTKGVIGAGISIGINVVFDFYKNKNKKK